MEMAEATIRLLFDMIEGLEVTKRQVYDAELIIGQSVRTVE